MSSEDGTMNSLVRLTIDAHGGLERWRRFEQVSTKRVVVGEQPDGTPASDPLIVVNRSQRSRVHANPRSFERSGA
jgi:hypothetical protein